MRLSIVWDWKHLQVTELHVKFVNFAMLVPSALMQSIGIFVSQNIGAGRKKRAKKSMFTGIGVGLVVGCLVFALVIFKGDMLAGFSPQMRLLLRMVMLI